MYLHVLRVIPLMCDCHLTLHNCTGNALSKRGAARRDMLPLYERRNTTPRQQRLKWKGSNECAYCKFFHVSLCTTHCSADVRLDGQDARATRRALCALMLALVLGR